MTANGPRLQPAADRVGVTSLFEAFQHLLKHGVRNENFMEKTAFARQMTPKNTTHHISRI
ncbi:MAG: hypothetical protein LBU24_03165 [Methanocalculaceae archaeon]|jgi:hypothetical protein|nr:hypothetical protein [Methanocalculaceae archaeon]